MDSFSDNPQRSQQPPQNESADGPLGGEKVDAEEPLLAEVVEDDPGTEKLTPEPARIQTASDFFGYEQEEQPATVFRPTQQRPPWYESRLNMYLMLFAVIGPLGFYHLWKSTAFSRLHKTILTVVVVLFTILVVWLILIVGERLVSDMKKIYEFLSE